MSPYSNDIWDIPEISMKALNCWNDGPPTGLWLFCPLYTPPSLLPPLFSVGTLAGHITRCLCSQLFPNLIYIAVQCSFPYSFPILQVLYNVQQLGVSVSDLRLHFTGTHQVNLLLHRTSEKLLDIVNLCIKRFGEDHVLYE